MATPGDALLWLTDCARLSDAALEEWAGWLGPSERARLARFVRAERCRQFVAGRALLRLALGRLLGVRASDIVLVERPGRAPALEAAPAGLGFSISHSGAWVACAATLTGPVGLDIERIDSTRDVLALAEHAFGDAALARLRALDGGARIDAFYRMWCRHEAHIKLGATSAHDHFFSLPGLAGVLSCGQPLAAAPLLVDLEALRAGF